MQKLELLVRTTTKAITMRELELLAERGEVSRKVFEEKQRAYEELKRELELMLKQFRHTSKKLQVGWWG